MVYVVFNDRWWLCNDTTVKAMTPPPTRQRHRFYYRSGNKQIWLYQTCRSVRLNKQDHRPLVRHGIPRAYLLTPRCQPRRWHQVRSPPPLLQHRVHQQLGTSGTGLCMPGACLWTPLCQPRRWHKVHPPPSPTATQSASRVGDRNISTHAQSMPNEMCVAASAPLQTLS